MQHSYPIEVEHFGYTVLQHVVSCTADDLLLRAAEDPVLDTWCFAQVAVQWDKFSDEEHTQLASTAFSLLRKGMC